MTGPVLQMAWPAPLGMGNCLGHPRWPAVKGIPRLARSVGVARGSSDAQNGLADLAAGSVLRAVETTRLRTV